MFIFRLLLLAALFSISACVSTKNVPMGLQAGKNLANRTLAMSQREIPMFHAFTVDVALGGLNEGPQIRQKYGIEDPAEYIARTLAGDLAFKYGAEVVGFTRELYDGNNNFKLAAVPARAQYVLDVQTVIWGYGYFATVWDKYRALYTVKLRLIDTVQDLVVAEGFCDSLDANSLLQKNTDLAPTEYELLKNDAEFIKQELRAAAEFCIAQFRNNILGIGNQFAKVPIAPESPATAAAPLPEPDPVTTAPPTRESASRDDATSSGNVSGVYRSEITSNSQYIFKKSFRDMVIVVEQQGDRLALTSMAGDVDFSAVLHDDRIDYSTRSSQICACNFVDGSWRFSSDSGRLEGSWTRTGGGRGQWNLVRIGDLDEVDLSLYHFGGPAESQAGIVPAPGAASSASPGASEESANVIDVAGRYSSVMTGGLFYINLKNHKPQVQLEQNGDRITGRFGTAGGTLEGRIEGNTISFTWYSARGKGQGKWQVAGNGRSLVGNWDADTGEGTWNLARVGGREETGFSPLPDLSGTYASEITSNSHWIFKGNFRSMVLTLEHDGDTVRVVPQSSGVRISARVEGDKIAFSTTANAQCGCANVIGEWKVAGDGSRLEGSWKRSGGGVGAWNLRKIR